jgi:hypothetical protein
VSEAPSYGQVAQPQTRSEAVVVRQSFGHTDVAQAHESGIVPHGSGMHISVVPSPSCMWRQTDPIMHDVVPQGIDRQPAVVSCQAPAEQVAVVIGPSMGHPS